VVRVTTPADPVRRYLDQLRAHLRGADADLVLAEAEDHLREAVAAGLSAGLAGMEAQEAAISSFGSVRAVVRAHQSRRGRAAAVLSALAMAAWKLAWLLSLAYDVAAMAMYAYLKMGPHAPVMAAAPSAGGGLPVAWIALGTAGLPLLAGYYLARRVQRRRGRTVAARSGRLFPLVSAVFFGAAATTLVSLEASGAAPVNRPLILAALALAVGYAARVWLTLRRRGRLA
jgi:HAAS